MVHDSVMDEEEYSTSSIREPFSCSNTVISSTRRKNKNKNKNKSRFSDEQIKSLESMFESETRLDPRRKVQLAKELGLQPRQVAIWFQNKRARWKSKQLERDYNILRANYNNLASRFETLKKEKQAMLVQLQKLNELIKKQGEEVEHCAEKAVYVTVTCSKGESENGGRGNCELDNDIIDSAMKDGVLSVSDEDSSIKAECFGLEQEEPNLLNRPADGSMTTSQDDWGSLDSDALFDQPNAEYQWWNFWA